MTPRTCRECAATLVPCNVWRTLSPEERAERRAMGIRVHYGRGLCSNCYTRLYYRRDLIDLEKVLALLDRKDCGGES